MTIYRAERACRSCGSEDLASILAFGEMPLADRLLTVDELAAPDVAASWNAFAMSETWTKSRDWSPSSNTVGRLPARSLLEKIAATPV